MCHNISARPTGIYDDGLFHKSESRDGLTRSNHALARSVTRDDISVLPCTSSHSFLLATFISIRMWIGMFSRMADHRLLDRVIISLCVVHHPAK